MRRLQTRAPKQLESDGYQKSDTSKAEEVDQLPPDEGHPEGGATAASGLRAVGEQSAEVGERLGDRRRALQQALQRAALALEDLDDLEGELVEVVDLVLLALPEDAVVRG